MGSGSERSAKRYIIRHERARSIPLLSPPCVAGADEAPHLDAEPSPKDVELPDGQPFGRHVGADHCVHAVGRAGVVCDGPQHMDPST